MKVFLVILLLLILTSRGNSFGRRRFTNCKKETEQSLSKPVHYDPLIDQNATEDYHYDCDAAEFGIVQKIPYLRSCSTCDTIEINFSSACIRCGMCLAIAEKVHLFSIFYISFLCSLFIYLRDKNEAININKK